MTTNDTKTMRAPDTNTLLARIVDLTRERQENWLTGKPADDRLEAQHQAEIDHIKKSLSAGQVSDTEKPTAGRGPENLHRGGWVRAAGHLIKHAARWLRGNTPMEPRRTAD